MTPKIIGETREYLWLYKPAGLPVFHPHGDQDGDCLASWLIETVPEQSGFEPKFAAGIAHRLDNSTSGLMVACRSKDSLSKLREMFKQGELSKRYIFIPRASPDWSENHVTTRLAHHKRRKSRMVVERGRETPHRGKWYAADTLFERGENGIWRATITTGVMHQIRAHAGSVGLALAGDNLYGGGERPGGLPDGVNFALHHTGLHGQKISSAQIEPPQWWSGL